MAAQGMCQGWWLGYMICTATFLVGLGFYLLSIKERFVGSTTEKGVGTLLTTHPMHLRSGDASRLWKRWHVQAIPYQAASFGKDTDALRDASVLARYAPGQDPVLLLTDPLDAKTLFPDAPRRSVPALPKGYFVALTTLEKAIHLPCGYAWIGKKIGFFDRSDELFVQAVLHGYRVPKSAVTVQQVPVDAWDRLDEVLEELDLLVAYVLPGSAFHKLLQRQSLSVLGFRDVDLARISLFYPFVQLESVSLPDVLQDVPGSALRIMDREKDTQLCSMTLTLVELRGGGGAPTGSEGFLTRLRVSPESLDPGYRCYGDLSAESRALCESAYGIDGKRKPKPTVWDRPCLKNEDCPFYRKNRHYPNERGGCKQGFCELPIGMRRVGYRKYDDQGVWSPFCYRCTDPSDLACCARQRRSPFTLTSSGADYAFEGDRAAREAVALETILPMV